MYSMQLQPSQIFTEIANPYARLAGVSILAVDGNADNQEILRAVFEMVGAKLTVVSTVEAALAMLQKIQPKLLISEIELPDESGYALMRRVKALEAEHHIRIPVIALTIFARPEDQWRSLAAGFCEHITKPFDIYRLLASAVSLVES